MQDSWTSKDFLTLFLSIPLSIGSAFVYEWLVNKRRKKELRDTFCFLESDYNEFDWQHWNITNGIIDDKPIESYMTLKYDGNKTFSYRWKTDFSKNKENGNGNIFWDDLTHGKLSFFEYKKHWYDYRNVFIE